MTMAGMLSRAVLTVLVFIVTFLVFGIMANAEHSFAAISQAERPEEELLILELRVKDSVRSRGFLGYLPQGAPLEETLLPLGSLMRALSTNLDVNPALGQAEGWYIEERNSFRLDMAKNKVSVGSKDYSVGDGEAEAHYEDIFVRASALEKWFALKIEIDLGSLRLYVDSELVFPFEAEEARKKHAEQYGNIPASQIYDYSSAELMPYKWFSLPSVVLQQSARFRHNSDTNHLQGTSSVQASGDVMKFGTRLTLGGILDSENQSQVQNAQLTFQRRDPSHSLLGPMRAGTVAFGDVNFPDVPLIVSRKRGRGVSVSSDSNLGSRRSFGSEQVVIDGDAPIGWDAELYRNNHFVAFQEVGDNGRYSFEDVELIKGFNLFKIVFYGPEGQKRTETQRIVRGAKMLRKGETSYDLAAGQPESDFLPIAENSRTDSTFGASGRMFYGIRDNLTLGGSVFRGSDASSVLTEEQTAASVTAVAGFGGLRTQAQIMKANEGRSAYDLEASTRVLQANLAAGHTIYEGFNEDDQRIKERTNLSVSRNFGRVSANIEAEKRKFLEEDDEKSLKTTLSARIGPLNLTNRLERTWSDNRAKESFDGDFAAATDLYNWRFRSNLIYDLDDQALKTLRSARFSAQRRIGRDSRVRLNGDHNLLSRRSIAEARYTKEFEDFSLDVEMGGTNDREYFGGVTLRTALQADQDGKYRMVSAKDGGLGSVGIRAYLDANRNGLYDEGEKPLKNIKFRSNKGPIEDATNEQGVLFVNGLSESATRLSLQESSLPSIYLKPTTDYVDVIPRSGTTAKVDVGFTQLGEIDGFILAAEKSENGEPKAAAGIEVILMNADSGEEIDVIYSEYDGYYVFPAIELGNYQVRIGAIWTEVESSLPTKSVVLSDEEPIKMDVNITLPPRASAPLEISHNSDHITEIEPALGSAASSRTIYIHISSMSEQKTAEFERSRVQEKFSDILGNVSLTVKTVQVKSKTFFRIMGKVQDVQQGQSLCDQLSARNVEGGCRVFRMKDQNFAKAQADGFGHYIHMSSMSTAEMAKAELGKLQKQFGDIMEGQELFIREAVVHGKTYYRILGTAQDKADARNLCKELNSRKIEGGCRVIKN